MRFALAVSSTPKVELYRLLWEKVFAGGADLAPYLHKKPGKGEPGPGQPLFIDLSDDYDKTEGGQVKGIGQLRIKFDKYLEELAKRDEFSALGKNATERQQALEKDDVASALWQFDRNLNKFYVGNDADYFIHKDLRGFLTREKSRFIKQVIFSDLEALLLAGEDNATSLIARAFNTVADTIIGFLAAIENFQKGMFELKKKVVGTHYLISVGKIPVTYHERVFACEAQLQEWYEVFKVDVTEVAQLAEHPNLVVDTSLYHDIDTHFQDDLLSLPEFDNLDDRTDGLLINSENWQALSMLEDKYSGKITCAYNDPPYNTGKDEFLYKDQFKDSSWASFIKDRFQILKKLLSNDGVAFTSIDKNEFETLMSVEREVFESKNEFPCIVWRSARDNNPTRIAVEHEYITCFAKNTSETEAVWKNEFSSGKDLLLQEYERLKNTGISVEDIQKELRRFINDNAPLLKEVDRYKFVDADGVYTGSQSVHNPHKGGYDYEIEHPETKQPMSKPANGYRFPWETMKRDYIDKDRLIYGPDHNRIVQIKVYLHEYMDSLRSVIELDGRLGSYALRNIFGDLKLFRNPKPPQLIGRLIGFGSRNDSIVIDAFAGSGTTIQSVMEFNKQSNSHSYRFVCCEFGGYFDALVVQRCKRLMYSMNWYDGTPIRDNIDGSKAIVKIQRLEQYEDLLDNLTPVWDEGDLPPQIPVKYLFRPEQNALSASLDLSRPFSQTMRVGKTREEKTIDLMETWCYLQGYWVKSRRMYREFDRLYLAVETTHGVLVVFRDIDDAEDDSDNLNTIAAKYVDEHGVGLIQRLEVNHDADLRKLDMETILITAADFMRGAQWS